MIAIPAMGWLGLLASPHANRGKDWPHRLLVTGGAGFIGAKFVHYWLREHPDAPDCACKASCLNCV